MRNQFLPFHVPDLGAEEEKSILDVIRSGWLTTGPKVRQFELEFADYIGVRHAIAVNSGTAALHLALEAAGIGPGDEVLVPTMTFAATSEVVLYLNARPVFLDCQAGSFNLDPMEIEKKISKKTKAILPVHFGGEPCEMNQVQEISKRYRLKVIEDAAHAIPSKYEGRMIGTIGDATAFSFYATKNITTGEGGMITTEDDAAAEKIRIMCLHGISKDSWKRYTSEGSWYYEILYPGFKYNMTDLSAALGIEQLRKCDRFWRARKRLAELYHEGFSDLAEVSVPTVPDRVQHAWHLYVIRLNLDRLRIGRNEFIELLKKENIGTSVHFIPLHLHPYYRKTYGYRPEDFPHATALYERIISLPLYSKMTEQDTSDVIQVVRRVVTQNRK